MPPCLSMDTAAEAAAVKVVGDRVTATAHRLSWTNYEDAFTAVLCMEYTSYIFFANEKGTRK